MICMREERTAAGPTSPGARASKARTRRRSHLIESLRAQCGGVGAVGALGILAEVLAPSARGRGGGGEAGRGGRGEVRRRRGHGDRGEPRHGHAGAGDDMEAGGHVPPAGVQDLGIGAEEVSVIASSREALASPELASMANKIFKFSSHDVSLSFIIARGKKLAAAIRRGDGGLVTKNLAEVERMVGAAEKELARGEDAARLHRALDAVLGVTKTKDAARLRRALDAVIDA